MLFTWVTFIDKDDDHVNDVDEYLYLAVRNMIYLRLMKQGSHHMGDRAPSHYIAIVTNFHYMWLSI